MDIAPGHKEEIYTPVFQAYKIRRSEIAFGKSLMKINYGRNYLFSDQLLGVL